MKARLVRNAVFATAVAGSMLALTQTALADNGGNGEGKLAVFTSSDLQHPATALQWGGTYYIELENPGGKSKLWNFSGAPETQEFNFFNPTRTFHGDPGHWNVDHPTFTVKGIEIGTNVHTLPYVYKITLPSQNTNGDYTIETGPVQMHSNRGEDEMYFSNDPNIGGTISINPPTPAGQLPEVPYAGIIPAIVLAGGGLLYLRRRRQTRA